ncbi:Scr1 family TA system antitoxin-like transcriptional regulator [Streptomyces celluloflavus]|uniref:Scr1 family TA system antitoxin-like transcriptional regulator n=1 Tax=Streptomyces celluloflavus TaxID=58344 RepID=UPI0037AB5D52
MTVTYERRGASGVRRSSGCARRGADIRRRAPSPQAVAYDTTTSSVLFEDPEDMATHAQIFETLRSAALTPDQSLSFIRRAMKEIPESEKEKE